MSRSFLTLSTRLSGKTEYRRMFMSFGDQFVSSLGNVLALVAVARTAQVTEFGVVALLMAIITTGLSISRGALGTPLMLASGGSWTQITQETRHALAAAVPTGILIGAGVVVAGMSLGRPDLGIPLGLAGVVILQQDVLRYSEIARGRVERAALWDGLWAAGSAASVVITITNTIQPATVLWIWTAFAAGSLAGLALSSNTWIGISGIRLWWRSAVADRLRYAVEAGIGSTTSLLVASCSVVFIGTSAAAALRGAGTVLGPVSVLMGAIPLAAIPYFVRTGRGPRDTWRLLSRFAAAMSILALMTGALGFLLPLQAGSALLGSSWAAVAQVLPITGVEYAIVCWLSCIFTAMRAHGLSKPLLHGRVIYSGCVIVSSVLAALMYKTVVAIAIALALSALISCGIVGTQLYRRLPSGDNA